MPMAPPVSVSQSWGGQPAVAPEMKKRTCSTRHTPPRSRAAGPRWSIRASRRSGGRRREERGAGRPPRAAPRARHPVKRPEPDSAEHVAPGPGEGVDLAAVRNEVARLVGVGEERHRRLGVDQHQVGQPRPAGPPPSRPDRPGAPAPPPPPLAAGGKETSPTGAWPHGRTRWRRPGRERPTRQAKPPTRNPTGWPLRIAEATVSTAAASTAAGRADTEGCTGSAPSDHDTSAGRMSVATWPGGPHRRAHAGSRVTRQLGSLQGSSHPARHVSKPAHRCRTRAERRTACGTSRGRRPH